MMGQRQIEMKSLLHELSRAMFKAKLSEAKRNVKAA